MKIEFFRRVMGYIPPKLSLALLELRFYLGDRKRIRALKKRVDVYENTFSLPCDGQEKKFFFDTLRKYCLFGAHIGASDFIDSYFEHEDLRTLKTIPTNVCIDETDPILICCVKNDLKRIQKLYYYHKSIGIEHMVFVDNNSDDGTREWLAEKQVDLYFTDEEYSAGRKSAWIRKIYDRYGYNRWYLVVDSDELFTYPGIEKNNIHKFMEYVLERRLERVESFLLDMYPNHKLYLEETPDYVNEYRFFDMDSYYSAKDGRGFMLRGGPRKRAFEQGMDHSEPLSKYPLCYVEYGDIWSDHRPLPFSKNFKSECLAVLRHYKFMQGDFEKYITISQEGRYYNGSGNYKIYVNGGNDITLFYEKSVEYTNSYSLSCLKHLKTVDLAYYKG